MHLKMRQQSFFDQPEVADPGADKTIVSKVPVSNDAFQQKFTEIFFRNSLSFNDDGTYL